MFETHIDPAGTPKSPSSGDVTRLLLRWRGGHQEALDQLMPLVYEELHLLAHNYMFRERGGHLFQTTALVHEAYIRLVDLDVEWNDRHHFFALAARMMRRILVDLARRQQAEKRGGNVVDVPLEDALEIAHGEPSYLVALDDALRSLAQIDERKSQVLELRFFGGLTIQETSEVLELSTATVERDVKVAKAWLARELKKTTTSAQS